MDNGQWIMKENIIKKKSFDFALKIVQTCQYLVEDKKEFIMSRQLLKSGTAIGALIREAEQAESKADFIHKMSIALKEANETDYWIDLLSQSKYLDEKRFNVITQNLNELLKLLTSIIKTSKGNR
jgi:four helix bundle protein